MIATIIYPIWGCAVTAATVVVGLNMMAKPPAEAEMAMKVELPPVFSQPQLLVAPVVNKSKSEGYVFSNVSLEMDAEIQPRSKVPLEMIVQDAYLALIVGNPDFNFPVKAQFELEAFRSGLKQKINEFVGAELVRSLYVSGVNFLSREEARTKQTLKSVWLQKQGSNTPAPEPKDKKKDKK